MAVKDWLTVGIALLSLGVSLGSAYFSTFQKIDDLRVVITKEPPLDSDLGSGVLKVTGDHSVMFVNSGNRIAAITDIELWLEETSKELSELKKCGMATENPSVATYRVDRPIIVKPGEMTTTQLALLPNALGSAKGNFSIQLSKENRLAPRVNVYACMRFTVVTPDSAIEKVDVPVSRIWFNRRDANSGASGGGERVTREPILLVHKRSTVFTDLKIGGGFRPTPADQLD